MDSKLYPTGRGGLKILPVGRTVVFSDGITHQTIFTINLDTQEVTFEKNVNAEGFTPDITFDDGTSEGRMQWNSEDGALEVGLPGGVVNLQIGQEMIFRAKNESGSTIADGTVIRISGATGSRPKIVPATNAAFPGADAVGVATEPIDHNQFGYVTAFGLVRGIDTSHVTAGATAWLGVDGAFTETRPTAPSFSVVTGHVITSGATGVLFVHFAHSPRLAGLSDVYVPGTPANGQYLAWSTANSRWELAGP